MKIHTAKFIKGIIGTDDILYDGKFQVAFPGRSDEKNFLFSLPKSYY